MLAPPVSSLVMRDEEPRLSGAICGYDDLQPVATAIWKLAAIMLTLCRSTPAIMEGRGVAL